LGIGLSTICSCDGSPKCSNWITCMMVHPGAKQARVETNSASPSVTAKCRLTHSLCSSQQPAERLRLPAARARESAQGDKPRRWRTQAEILKEVSSQHLDHGANQFLVASFRVRASTTLEKTNTTDTSITKSAKTLLKALAVGSYPIRRRRL
jgi:hypothetical protein